MQDVEDGEGAPSGAHFFHGRLVEPAPFDGELHPVDAGDALALGKRGEVAADAGAPVGHRAEDVKQAGFDVLQGSAPQPPAR
jgi:hypothetical protein